MRKFIISDLHGNGNVYNSIMSYLENINKEEDVTLYINGDLIDRGPDSAQMLLDVIEKSKTGPFKIVYLAGNHELLMYDSIGDWIKTNKYDPFDNWHENGGWVTDYNLQEILDNKGKLYDIYEYISNLKIYHKFKEKVCDKQIVLVHAACPSTIKDECDIRIKDKNEEIVSSLFARNIPNYFPFRTRIGNDKYFSIIGHTPNKNDYGFEYNDKENILNIDGGSSNYVSGYFDQDHVPLVEVKDNELEILTFNNNNSIIFGNYLRNGLVIPMKEDELNTRRSYLNKNIKIKRLVKDENNMVLYEDDFK